MLKIRQYHLSHSPIHRIHSVKQIHYARPDGLWFTPHIDAWRDITTSMKGIEPAYLYEVVLRKDANIVVVETVDDIKWFTKEFYCRENKGIDWKEVARRWDGFYAANYMEDRLLEIAALDDTFWWYAYLTFESGIVWNHKAVKSLKKV